MQISSWQSELQRSVKDPLSLLEQLNLPLGGQSLAGKSLESFPVRVPPSYLDRIRKNEPDDPLLKQVLPLIDEDVLKQDSHKDPLNELDRQPVPGLLHKYHGRVLLIATGACAIHCRYCFRRHFPYNENNPSSTNWSDALSYIRNDLSITEVILSGGDPLTLSDEKMANLLSLLAEIPHLKRLRIHTRIPVVLPSRITDTFLDILNNQALRTVIVIHSNHVNEIDNEVGTVFNKLKSTGITLLNQSVLLKGVNDEVNSLATLSEILFEHNVLPYYLHLLDRVEGAEHFNVSEKNALALMHGVRSLLPGYLAPRLVREVPEKPYKIPVL